MKKWLSLSLLLGALFTCLWWVNGGGAVAVAPEGEVAETRGAHAPGGGGTSPPAPAAEVTPARVDREARGAGTARDETGAVTLRGRVLAPDGAPYSESWLEYSARSLTATGRRLMTGGHLLITDPDGRFSLTWFPGAQERQPYEFRFQQLDGFRKPISGATVGWPEDSRDFGVIQLIRTPLLASGRVVDDRGKPLHGVAVTLLQHLESAREDDASPTAPDGLRIVLEADPEPRTGWRAIPELRAITDSRGSFLLRGATEEDVLRLAASTPRHVPRTSPDFAPGGTNLTLVLRRLGLVEGRLILPAGVRGRDVLVELAYPRPVDPGPTDAELDRKIPVQRTGRFELGSVPAGAPDLRVSFPPHAEPLVTIPAILIPCNGEAGDPRLSGIDLRGTVHSLRVTVLDPDGEPVPDGWIHYGQHEYAPQCRRVRLKDGAARLIARSLPLDWLEVRAPGYSHERFERVAEDAVLTLRRGIHVTLRLADGLSLPEGPCWFTAAVRGSRYGVGNLDGSGAVAYLLAEPGNPEAFSGPLSEEFTVPRFEGRQLRLVVPVADSYTIELLVRGLDRSGAEKVRLAGDPTLVIEPGATSVEFVVSPEPTAWRALCERVEEERRRAEFGLPGFWDGAREGSVR